MPLSDSAACTRPRRPPAPSTPWPALSRGAAAAAAAARPPGVPVNAVHSAATGRRGCARGSESTMWVNVHSEQNRR